jgi:cytoskeleton protein RodZ
VSLFQRIKTPFTESGDEEMTSPRPRPRPVGEILRERREELQLDLDRIGEVLRIKAAYLAALEQGRPQDLPGPTYVIGFVRAYAHHLGLDAERVLERYKAESTDVHTRPDLAFPVALGERSVPGGPILLVALILAICGYGTWYYLSTDERSRPERVAAVPPSLQMPPPPGVADRDAGGPPAAVTPGATDTGTVNADTSAGAAASPRLSSGLFPTPNTGVPADTAGSTPSIAPPGPAATVAQTPATPTPAESGSPPSAGTARAAPPQQAAAAPQAASTTDPKAPSDAGGSTAGRIDIRALADCWVQVRAADQAIVFSRVLKSGETYHVPAQPGLFLRTGNAGALAITVDGKPAPSLGGIGTLRRNVALDPDQLIGGTAVHG